MTSPRYVVEIGEGGSGKKSGEPTAEKLPALLAEVAFAAVICRTCLRQAAIGPLKVDGGSP